MNLKNLTIWTENKNLEVIQVLPCEMAHVSVKDLLFLYSNW